MAATQVDLTTRKLWYGAAADLQTVSPVIGDTFFINNSPTGQLIEYTGDGFSWIPVRATVVGGLSTYSNGGSGVGVDQTREVVIGAITTRGSILYPDGDGPTSITIALSAVIGIDVYCLVCFNAQSDGQADGFLQTPANPNINTRRKIIRPYTDLKADATITATTFDSRILKFDFEVNSPLKRLDYRMEASGGADTLLAIEGVG